MRVGDPILIDLSGASAAEVDARKAWMKLAAAEAKPSDWTIVPPGDYSEPFMFPEGAKAPGSVPESELACGLCGDDGTMYDQDEDGNGLEVPCVCVETEDERTARFVREANLKANLSKGGQPK